MAQVFLSITTLMLSLVFSTSPSRGNQEFCPDFVLVGARGSGEKTPHQLLSNKGKYIDASSQSEIKSYKAWLGETIGSLYTELITMKGTPFVPFNPENRNQKNINKKSLAWLSYGVVKNETLYPASGLPKFTNRDETRAYLGEVTTANIGLLEISLRDYSKKCPNTRYFLVGYSQGAAIIRLSVANLSQIDDKDLIQRVSGVVLIADPLLSPRDSRLEVGRDSRWTGTTTSCGVLRLLAGVSLECSISLEGTIGQLIFNSLKGYWTLGECAVKSGCENSFAVDAELAKIINPAFSTSEIANNTGVNNIISVCYVGDVVCSLLGERSKQAWATILTNNPGKIHSNEYKKPSTSAAIARWLERRI